MNIFTLRLKVIFQLTILVIFLFSGSNIKAQSELGVVWTKEYDFATNGVPMNLMPQPLYYAETGESRYIITGSKGLREGFIAVMDESGTILNEWTVPIPSYYNKYPKMTARQKAQDIGITFTSDGYVTRYNNYYRSAEPEDILAAVINTAVMKRDGSILAFGHVIRYRADMWKADSDIESDFSPGSHDSFRMKQGIWIVKINADGTLESSETARGAETYTSLFIYEDKVLLPGLDIHSTTEIGAAGGKGVGMLHEYTLDGQFVRERCPDSRDNDPIVGASMYLDGDILLYGWSGRPALKIDPENPNGAGVEFDATKMDPNLLNQPMSGMPTVDGGGFLIPSTGMLPMLLSDLLWAVIKVMGN